MFKTRDEIPITMTAKKQTPAETKKENESLTKKIYRISENTDGRTHQVVYSIEQKITWISEVGKREEWIKVREWKIGMKAGHTIKQIMKNISEAQKGLELSKETPFTTPERNYYKDNEDNEEDE